MELSGVISDRLRKVYGNADPVWGGGQTRVETGSDVNDPYTRKRGIVTSEVESDEGGVMKVGELYTNRLGVVCEILYFDDNMALIRNEAGEHRISRDKLNRDYAGFLRVSRTAPKGETSPAPLSGHVADMTEQEKLVRAYEIGVRKGELTEIVNASREEMNEEDALQREYRGLLQSTASDVCRRALKNAYFAGLIVG